MDEITELMNSVFGQDYNSAVTNYLQSCSELRCFYNNNDSVPRTISLINKLLNESNTREKGLKLLQVFLPQCIQSEVSSNIVSWMSQCLKGVLQKENKHSNATPLEVFCSLLDATGELYEVRPQVTANIIPKFLDLALNLLNTQPKKSALLLACLEKCFILYGKACANTKGMIHSQLLKLLDYPGDVVSSASKCYCQLALLGPPGSELQNYKTAWQNQHMFLIDTMHSILNILFDNVNEIQISYKRATEAKTVEESKVTKVNEKSPLLKAQILTDRFAGLAKYLIAMLRLSFPATKLVDTNAILSVVCRTLAVTCFTLKSHTTVENIALITQIPTLHVWCLQTLEAMIQCCHMISLKHTTVICKLLSQSLKWTVVEDSYYGQDKPYASIREHAYNCLTCWLVVARAGSSIENYVEDFKAGLIADICSSRPSITLTLNKPSKGIGKVGKRKRNMLLKNTKEKPKCLVNKEANKTICCAALKALTFILESSSTLLKPKFHKEMQEVIVKLLMQLQLGHVSKIPIPYGDEECRLALYTALLALNNNFHPHCLPPYQLSSMIFNNGLTDPSMKVMQFCSMALGNINCILCPIFPGMLLPANDNDKFRDDDCNEEKLNSLITMRDTSINNQQIYKAASPALNSNEISNICVEDEIEPDTTSSQCEVKEITSNTDECDSSEIGKHLLSDQKEILPEGISEESSPTRLRIDNPTEIENGEHTNLVGITDTVLINSTNEKIVKDPLTAGVENVNDDEIPRKKIKLDEGAAEPPVPNDIEEEEMMSSFVDELDN